MHTNTTGGPTDRPVLHRRPEDAADQPTTEPSAVERVAEHLYETADPADKEHYRDASHDLVAHSWCELAPVWRRRWIERAKVLADAGLLAPAPQPATDTETEVQWGVRLTGHGGEQHTTPHPTEDSARAEQRLNQKYFEHGDEAWSALWASSAVVRHTCTPWEEA